MIWSQLWSLTVAQRLPGHFERVTMAIDKLQEETGKEFQERHIDI